MVMSTTLPVHTQITQVLLISSEFELLGAQSWVSRSEAREHWTKKEREKTLQTEWGEKILFTWCLTPLKCPLHSLGRQRQVMLSLAQIPHKVLLFERLVRKNYFDLRVQKTKASRGSLPQLLAEVLSWVTFLCLGQARPELTVLLMGSRYLRDLYYIHGDLLLRLSAALSERCHHLTNWTSLLNWERNTQTFLQFPTNQLQHPSPESDAVSPPEQAAMRTARGAHVNETPGKRNCQSSKEGSVALQHTCEYQRSWTPCLHTTRSVTIIKIQTLQHGTF